MVDIADLARSGYLTSIASDSEKIKSLLGADKLTSRFQLSSYERRMLEKTAIDARSFIQRYDIQEAMRKIQPLTEYLNQNAYSISDIVRQSQSFQSYWIDWSYIPSHEKIKFLIQLNKVSNNITPALSIAEIVLLWFQDFEDKRQRIKKAEKLIKLILNGLLTASFYSRELHLEPFDKQVKTIIAIDNFERCALDGFISKSAPEFASYWRAKLKTQLVLPVQAAIQIEPKTREGKGLRLLRALLGEWNRQGVGTPSTSSQLFNYCMKHPPQGFSELQEDKEHGKYKFKEANQPDSISIKAFKNIFREHVGADA